MALDGAEDVGGRRIGGEIVVGERLPIIVAVAVALCIRHRLPFVVVVVVIFDCGVVVGFLFNIYMCLVGTIRFLFPSLIVSIKLVPYCFYHKK